MVTNDDTTITDGIAVNEISAEFSNLVGVCRAAADRGDPLDQERALYAVAFSLDVLNARLSEIGARLKGAA